MRRYLLLSDKTPKRFVNTIGDGNGGKLSIEEVEDRIVSCLNEDNPKLNLVGIQYMDNKGPLAAVPSSYSGLIADKFEYPSGTEIAELDLPTDTFIEEKEDEVAVWQVRFYVFLTPTEIMGRNVMISQQVFPDYLDLVERALASSSYRPTNHPSYLINVCNFEITALSVRRRIELFAAMGFRYVEVFTSSISEKEAPRRLEDICQRQQFEYSNGLCFSDDKACTIDCARRIININADSLRNKIARSEDGSAAFIGSSEKFYWSSVLPLVIVAAFEDYEINYSDYEKFIVSNRAYFLRGDKFPRCETLLKYFKKLARG